MIQTEHLLLLSPQLGQQKAESYANALQRAAKEFGIESPSQCNAFLAQVAHESAHFRHLEELWGPTPAQRRYEGRKDLGNVQAGDGHRFRGRGFIQLTGRSNYRRFGQLLGLPLESHPELAAEPKTAARIAACYWHQRGCNALADRGDFDEITRRINGGQNGREDRLRLFKLLQNAPPSKILLVPLGGGVPVPWNGKDRYGGHNLKTLMPLLQQAAPKAGGPWEVVGLKVWRRRNGELVLERA